MTELLVKHYLLVCNFIRFYGLIRINGKTTIALVHVNRKMKHGQKFMLIFPQVRQNTGIHKLS